MPLSTRHKKTSICICGGIIASFAFLRGIMDPLFIAHDGMNERKTIGGKLMSRQSNAASHIESRERQRVVILPGPHKTGTTSLQLNLAAWTEQKLLGKWTWPVAAEVDQKRHDRAYLFLMEELLHGRPSQFGNLKKGFRKEFQKVWSEGQSIVFGTEAFDILLVPRGHKQFQGTNEKIVDSLLSLMPWVPDGDGRYLHGSNDNIVVAVTYRAPRVKHLISVWHQIGKGESLSHFLLSLPFSSRHWHCDINPLGLANAFVQKDLSTLLIDTSGLARDGLDISVIVACEVLNVPCENHSVVGLADTPVVANQRKNRGHFDLSEDQLERIDEVLRRIDCNYYHLRDHPKVKILHSYDLDRTFSWCSESMLKRTGIVHAEAIHTIKEIATGYHFDRAGRRE